MSLCDDANTKMSITMDFDDVTLACAMPELKDDVPEHGNVNHHCSKQCFSHSETVAFDTITHQERYPWPSVIKQQDSTEHQSILRFLSDATVYRKHQNKLASWTHYCGALSKALQVPEMAKENGIYIVLKVVVFVVKTRLNHK